MPENLWNLQLAHKGYQGIVRTKSRLRDKVWWPQMDRQLEALIQHCHPCQLVGSRPKREPIKSTPMPDKPWSELSIDLLDVPGEHHLLVVVDYYSRWPEVTFMKKTDAENVIKCLEKMFRTHGLPILYELIMDLLFSQRNSQHS